MAFAYTSGTATSIDNWFSIFEAWITGTVGWTIESGTGTDDIVLSSNGEAADKTKLFVHVRRDPSAPYPYRIRGEVQDDAVGTNATLENGYIQTMSYGGTEGGNYAFFYAITANKDAIVLVVRGTLSSQYWMLYLGLIEPFALSVPDETYHMIATGTNMTTCSVLRNYNDTWNVDYTIYGHTFSESAGWNILNNSFYVPVGSMYAGNGPNIIGQLYHVGQLLSSNAIPKDNDEGVSVLPGGTTTWTYYGSATAYKIALRTGGMLPSEGINDGEHYAYTTGTADSISEYFGILRTLLGQVGWNETDFSGSSGYTEDWLFDSTGESGNETIYIRIYWNTSSTLVMRVQDDSNFAPGNSISIDTGSVPPLPAIFHCTADRDCIFITIDMTITIDFNRILWGGLLIPTLPDIPTGSEYKAAAIGFNTNATIKSLVLRDYLGNEAQTLVNDGWDGDGTHNNSDNPNNFDGITYMLYPISLYDTNAIGVKVPYGRVKYIYHIGAANISEDDTITIGSRVYTVLKHASSNTAQNILYCLRTDEGLYSSSSSSFSSSSSSSST